jgi:hypothetical protein
MSAAYLNVSSASQVSTIEYLTIEDAVAKGGAGAAGAACSWRTTRLAKWRRRRPVRARARLGVTAMKRLMILSIIAMGAVPTHAQTSSLTRVMLDPANTTPFKTAYSYGSVNAVADFYGVESLETQLATEFFANGAGNDDKIVFVRFVPGGGRARIFGPDLSTITLAQVQALDGATLDVTMDGIASRITMPSMGADAPSNITDPCTFPPAGSERANCLYALAADIQDTFNTHQPQIGEISSAAIVPGTASFTATISGGIMDVSSVASGTVYPGALITAGDKSYSGHVQWQYQGPGGCTSIGVGRCTAGGVGQYGVLYSFDVKSRNSYPVTTPTTITETYGLVSISKMASGNIQLGAQVSGTGVKPGSYLEYLVGNPTIATCSGVGCNGTQWIVPLSQTVSGEMAVLAANVWVTYKNVQGATKNKNMMWLEKTGMSGNNPLISPTMSWARGTLANAMRWTSDGGGVLSNPGELVVDPAAFMTTLVDGGPNPHFSNCASIGGRLVMSVG